MLRFKLFILVLFLVSCGSRKVAINKQDIRIDSVSKVEETISTKSQTNQHTLDTTVTVIECFEPINENLPMVINGKTYQNVRFKSSKTKNGISISSTKESVLDSKKSSLDTKSVTKVTKVKDIEKQNIFPWWIWLVIVLVIAAYFINKRLHIL